MKIKKAQYVYDKLSGKKSSITITFSDENKRSVPLEPANTDYGEIMRQVEAGELTIQPADSE